MPFDPCDPCCNPAAAARDVDTYRQGVLVTLCGLNVLTETLTELTQELVGGETAHPEILTVSNVYASSGDNAVIAAPGAGLFIHVVAIALSLVSTTAITAKLMDNVTASSPVERWRYVLQTPAGVSGGANLAASAPAYLFRTSTAAKPLILNLSSAVSAHLSVSYFVS